LTDEEFMSKCDCEGGIEEAIFGYGLSEDDLDVKEGPFYEAVKELASMRSRIDDLTQVMYDLVPEDD